MKRSVLGLLVGLLFPAFTWGSPGVLENPLNGSHQSGIGIVSGWKCPAGIITVRFDSGAPLEVASGTSRNDTIRVCGTPNTGFGLLVNWNLLDDGQHTAQVFADGVLFASVTFIVTTLGTEFLTGAEGTYTLNNFPSPGQNVTVQWQESAQNFVIRGVSR